MITGLKNSNQKCIIRDQDCNCTNNSSNICFIACPHSYQIKLELDLVQKISKKLGFKPYIAVREKVFNKDIFCEKICSKIIEAKVCIVFLNEIATGKKKIKKPNANVYYEYGMMTALGKNIIPISKEGQKLAFNIQSLDILRYNKKNFSGLIKYALKQFISTERISQNEEIYSKYKNTKFKLLSAIYCTDEYSIDVYDELVLMIKENELKVTSSNNIAGDPHKGVRKKLIISYISYGKEYKVEIPENETRTLP